MNEQINEFQKDEICNYAKVYIVSAIGQRVWVETSTWPYNWENLVRQRGRETSFQTYAREGLFVGGQMDSRCLSWQDMGGKSA